jgi:starvation-inducible DNA-binding protein
VCADELTPIRQILEEEVSMSKSELLQQKAEVADVYTGIKRQDRKKLALGLSRALAETYVLYAKTQGFHWNVVGPLFYGLHKLTEEQYENLADAVDELAERIRALGYPAPATLAEFIALSAIKESPGIVNADEAIRQLNNDHEGICRTLRETASVADEFSDQATADMLTDRLKSHEQMAWMLRSLIAS